ncbi:hypothetical protein ACFLVN_02650 [Chloroflexota bacterium]
MTDGCSLKSEMALLTRFEVLIGNVSFRSDYDKAVDSPEHLMAIGEHNLREYEKIESMDGERKERLQNLVVNLLARALQKEAMEKYGNTERSSIRQILQDRCDGPETQAYLDRLRQTFKRCLLSIPLTEDQCEDISAYHCSNMWPQVIIEAIEELVSPSCVLPFSETQSLTRTLTDMMKEVENANNQQHS